MSSLQYDQAANGVLHQREATQWPPQADGQVQGLPEEGLGRQETQGRHALQATRPQSADREEARAKPARARGTAMEEQRSFDMGKGASAGNVSSPGQDTCSRNNGMGALGSFGACVFAPTQQATQAADTRARGASVEVVGGGSANGEGAPGQPITTRVNEPMEADDEHQNAEPEATCKPAIATTSELIELIREQNYRCALTGRQLTPDSCAVDHIKPIGSGQVDHSITNLQIITREANRAKGMLSNEEFIELCADVVATRMAHPPTG